MSIQATIGDTANLGSLDVIYAKDNKVVPEYRTNNDVVSLNIRSDFNETKKFSPKKLSAFKRFFRWKSDAEPGTPTSDAPPSPTERTSFKSDTDPATSNSTSSINFYGMGDTSRNVLGPHGKSDLIYIQTPESNSPKRISSFDELYIHSDIKEKEFPNKSCEPTIDERILKAVPEVASTRSFTTSLHEDVDVASNGTKLMNISSDTHKSPRALENLEIAAVTVGQEMLILHGMTDAQSIITVSDDDDECTILTTAAENFLTSIEAIAEVSPGSNHSTSDHVMLTNIVQDNSTALSSFRDMQFEIDASNKTILTDTLAPLQDSPVKDDPTSPLSPVGNSVQKSECQTNLNLMWLKKDLADSNARCSMTILRPTSPLSLEESVSEFKVKVAHACQESVSNNSPARGAGDSLIVSMGSEISKVTTESQGLLEPTGNRSPDCTVTLMTEKFSRGISKNQTTSLNNKLVRGSPTLRTPTVIECQSASANIKQKSIEIISLLSGTKVAAHETLWKGDRHVSSIGGNYSSPMNKVLLQDKAIIDQMSNKVTIGVLLADGDARGKFRKPQAFLAGEIASFDEDSEGESEEYPNENSVALETELSAKRLLSKPFDIEDDYVDEEIDLEKQSEVIMMSLKSARFAKRLDYLKSVSKLNHNRGLTMAADGNNPSEVYYSKDECCDVEGIKHLSSTSLHSISNISDRLREAPETTTTESGRNINAATFYAPTSPANKTDEEDVTSPDTDKVIESNSLLEPIQNDQDLIPEVLPILKKSTSSKAPSLLGRLFGPQILICCASDHR